MKKKLQITLEKPVIDKLECLAREMGFSKSALVALLITEKYEKIGGK